VDKLYYSPGAPTSGSTGAELYTYDGTNHTKVWTGPDRDGSEWFITYLYQYNGNLLVFMSDRATLKACRIYEFNPSTNVATLRVSDYQPSPSTPGYVGVFGVAEFNGYLYLTHSGSIYPWPTVLMRLNTSTWALDTIQTVNGVDDGLGGVAAPGDGYIYWNTDRYIYSSSSGEADSFTQLYDMGNASVTYAHSNSLHVHSDGYVYAASMTSISAVLHTRIFKIKDNAVDVDHDIASGTRPVIATFKTVGDSLLAISWFGPAYIKSGGSWSVDIADTNAMPTSSVIFGGKVYWGGWDDATTNNVTLKRRDSAGSTTEVQEYPDYTVFNVSTETFPMALVPNVGDGLYYSPGRKSTAPYAAELYVYDGVNTPSLVWTGPPYVAYEARWVLCHLYNYNGKILIFMFNTSGDVEARRVYEFDPVTRNTVLRVNDYEPEVGGDTWTGVFSVAEHNGKLLISHAGNANDVILSRLDPSDWSITFIQKVESVDDGVGGIVVHDDGYIYWNTGQFILSSTTGEPGSFTEIYDMNGPWNTWAVSNDLQPHTDGYVYCGGIYTEASGHNRQRIYKIRDNTVTVDHDEDHLSFEEQCIQVAFESTPEGLFAIPWFGEIYVKNGGTWQSDGTVTNWSNTPHSAYFKGKVYWGGDNEPRQLRRRDAPGSVSVVATHDNWAVPIYEESMPMVVAPYYPLATRRPRVQFIRIGK
jgi:hypothetical protein